MCYGEKGGYGGWLVSAPLHGSLIDFQGGVAHNVVRTVLMRWYARTPPR